MSKKISQYTELATTPATGDFFLLELASNGQYRKIKWSNVLPNNSITTAKIVDDAVTAEKIDWASTGADGGIWWEELARATLGVAGDTIDTGTFTARKYLRFMVYAEATGGALDTRIRFNADTGSNYSYQYNVGDGNANGSTTSAAFIDIDQSPATGNILQVTGDIINIATKPKLLTCNGHYTAAAASAASTPLQVWGHWSNVASQITRVQIINSGAGDLAIGSEVIILGHD